MANFNKVFLMGNLTRDPELRTIPSGQTVCELGLATNRYWTTPQGEKKEEVTFLSITVWGRQAESCSKYLSKGRPVFVEGRLKFDQWESPEGQKRSKLHVVAERVQFLGSPRDGAGSDTGSYQTASAPSAPSQGYSDSNSNQFSNDFSDENLPF